MKRKLNLLGFALLLASMVTNLFAQSLDGTKVYTIVNNNDAAKFMQDNSTGGIALAAKNGNSYWKFVSTGNADCYYIQNVATGKYMQGYSATEQEVEMGDTGVEYYVKADADGSLAGKYRMSCTANSPHDFSNGTLGLNWKGNDKVQSFASVAGGNPRSAWAVTVVETLTTATGQAFFPGNDAYLYNVESGLWLQNNDSKANDYSTRGAIGTRGINWKLVASDGAYAIQPYFYVNNTQNLAWSINPGNNYIDSDNGKAWTFEPKEYAGVSNTYKIYSGDKVLGTVRYNEVAKQNNLFTQEGDERWYLENPDFNINMAERNTWQLWTKEERLAKAVDEASETNPVDVTWLIPAADFANNDTRYNLWTKELKKGNGRAADGDGIHGSMCIESWDSESIDFSITLTGVPNGIYHFTLQGFYRDGNETTSLERRNNNTETIRSYYYANNVEHKLKSIFDDAKTAKVDGAWNDQYGDYWVPGGGDGQVEANKCFNLHKGYVNEEIEVIVTGGTLKLGVKKTEMTGGDWTVFDNFHLTYLGPVNISEYINALNQAIAVAQSIDNNKLSTAVKNLLAEALADGQAALSSSDKDVISNATAKLLSAINAADGMDVRVLKATILVAEPEGVDVTAANNVVENSMSKAEIEKALYDLRAVRKLNAAQKHKIDITKIKGSEPANGEFYLVNVGTGLLFNTTTHWGCHIDIDNPGMLINFVQDGEWSGAPGRPVFHLSGNGWNGMNWGEEYWDKNGENKLAFVPVEGKDKVYYFCEWDNYNWHFVYDVTDGACDAGTFYWNAVQKRDKNPNEYKNDLNAQWMLVTAQELKNAYLAKATEENPVDATVFIKNPGFDRNGNTNFTDGWTNPGNVVSRAGGNRDNQDGRYTMEFFQSNANMTQTLTGLRPGKYQVSVSGFYRDGNTGNEVAKVKNGETLNQTAKLVASTNTANVEALLPNLTSEAGNYPGLGVALTDLGGMEVPTECFQAEEYFAAGLYKVTTPIIEVGPDGKLTIGINNTYNDVAGSWVLFDNFRLTYLGLGNQTMAIVGDFSEDGWEATKGIPMTLSEDNNSIWTATLNNFEVKSDKLNYEFKSFANGKDNEYVLPATENQTYNFDFDGARAGIYNIVFTANTADNTVKISAIEKVFTAYYDNTLSNWNKVYAWAWIENGENYTGGTWPGVELTEKDANGNYIFSITRNLPNNGPALIIFNDGESNQTADLNFVNGATYMTINENADYVAKDINNAVVILNRTLVDNNGTWNTFCVPFDISNNDLKAQFGDDVKVAEYSETADGENSTVNFSTMATPAVTANVPVLLKSNTTETSFVFGGAIKTGEAKVAGNNYDFVGTYTALTTIPENDYFLSSNKLYKSAGATTIAGTRAYIKAKAAGARVVKITFDGVDDTTTGIETIGNGQQKVDNMFDLQGRRVNNASKSGVYIMNGKKVVVK